MEFPSWFIAYALFCIAFAIVLAVINIRADRAARESNLLPEEKNYFISLNGEKE